MCYSRSFLGQMIGMGSRQCNLYVMDSTSLLSKVPKVLASCNTILYHRVNCGIIEWDIPLMSNFKCCKMNYEFQIFRTTLHIAQFVNLSNTIYLLFLLILYLLPHLTLFIMTIKGFRYFFTIVDDCTCLLGYIFYMLSLMF